MKVFSSSIGVALALTACLGSEETPPPPPPAVFVDSWSTVEVIAGETSRGIADGVGGAARFNGPAGLGIDGSRALISDTFSGTVRALDLATATVTTLLRPPAVIEPRGITGANGVIYFGDANCIRRLDDGASEPVVLAGDCYSGGFADGAAATARFEFLLHDLALDVTRNALYASDRLNDAIRAVDLTSGAVSTLAGGAGAGSDDGVGGEARFDGPGGIAFDPSSGVLYVADTFNSTIRAIDVETSTVTTVAGVADVAGSIDGPVASARLSQPQGLALVERALVFGGFDGAARVLDLDALTVTTITSALAGTFATPVAIPGERAVLWMDLSDSLLRVELDAGPSAAISHVAGPRAPFGFIDGDGPTARFTRPTAVEIDEDGRTAYVSDLENHAVRVIDLIERTVRTLVGGPDREGDRDGAFAEARLSFPTGLALDRAARVLYLADAGNRKIRALDLQAGEVITLAGSGARGGGDGAATEASFVEPWELALDGGALYVADSGAATVRRIDIDSGAVDTLAGSYQDDDHIDGPGMEARFRMPVGLAVVGDALFVSDYQAHTIRRIELSSGATTTLLGTDGFEGSVGGPADFAALSAPSGLAAGPDGISLLVVEEGGGVLRRVLVADGSSSLVVGDGVAVGGIGTGVVVPIAEATLLEPQDVAAAGNELVVLSDAAIWHVLP